MIWSRLAMAVLCGFACALNYRAWKRTGGWIHYAVSFMCAVVAGVLIASSVP